MPRILLIEPHEDIRKLVEVTLDMAGHDVAAVPDGQSAIAALEEEFFACVIVGSPVVVEADGRELIFLEYIEQRCPEWRPCMVVITSWIDSARLLAAAQRLDVCAVFAKPFSAPELMAVLEECIAGRRPPRRWHGIPDALVAGL